MVNKLLDVLHRLLRETRCFACTAPFDPNGAVFLPSALFCPNCLARLQKTNAACRLCGEPLPGEQAQGAVCGECQISPPPWEGLSFYGPYRDLLQAMLIGLKFNHQLAYGHALGCLLASALPQTEEAFDALVPVPLHKERLRSRGFNQALELCRPLAKILNLRPESGLLQRLGASAPQTGLDKKGREANTKGIFTAKAEIRGRRVLLVDDVITTGATLKSACAALLHAGAKSVTVAVVARTPAASL